MNSVYNSIMTGLSEAIEDANGTNHPSGAASRLLSMMEMNHNLVDEFPFVKMSANG